MKPNRPNEKFLPIGTDSPLLVGAGNRAGERVALPKVRNLGALADARKQLAVLELRARELERERWSRVPESMLTPKEKEKYHGK